MNPSPERPAINPDAHFRVATREGWPPRLQFRIGDSGAWRLMCTLSDEERGEAIMRGHGYNGPVPSVRLFERSERVREARREAIRRA